MNWYQKAAEKEDAFSEFRIGAMYEEGKGVKVDKAIAIEWYQKAVSHGSSAAKNRLIEMEFEEQQPKQ